MIKTILTLLTLISIGLTGMSVHKSQNSETKTITKNESDQSMNNYISIFEIPATDINRAITFYQTILEIEIEKMDLPEMEMGILPYENQAVVGVIIKADGYSPNAEGVTIYLNGGDNLQTILDKVEMNGGKMIIPKTPHADGIGYFAIFIDSEGNRLGLHSPN
jgi:predicted enzyme related to lactoylglutathione lyase